jgi:hypothetical protein
MNLTLLLQTLQNYCLEQVADTSLTCLLNAKNNYFLFIVAWGPPAFHIIGAVSTMSVTQESAVYAKDNEENIYARTEVTPTLLAS